MCCYVGNEDNVEQPYLCKCVGVGCYFMDLVFVWTRVHSVLAAAAVEATIYFWHLTLKLTLCDGSGPMKLPQHSTGV